MPGRADLADQLTGLNLFSDCNVNFALMIIGGIDSPAMIDEGCVSTHS